MKLTNIENNIVSGLKYYFPINDNNSRFDLVEISDSDMDCFYTNRNVAIVLNKLEKEWHEEVS